MSYETQERIMFGKAFSTEISPLDIRSRVEQYRIELVRIMSSAPTAFITCISEAAAWVEFCRSLSEVKGAIPLTTWQFRPSSSLESITTVTTTSMQRVLCYISEPFSLVIAASRFDRRVLGHP